MAGSVGVRPVKRRLDSDYEKENITEGVTVPKRQKKAKYSNDASDGRCVIRKPRKNSKIGCLSLLLQMPVDIFYEIARSLSPKDLLSLARSTKSCRDLLMNSGSKPIWRAARDNVGLPDCPTDLSEPAYADLLYGRGCMFCNAPRAKNVYVAFRLRLCRSCFDKHARSGGSLIRQYAPQLDLKGDKSPYNLAPCYQELAYGRTKYDFEMASELGLIWFWEDEFVKVLNKYTRLLGQKKKKYVEKRMQFATEVNEHARLVDKWFEEQEKKQMAEKKDVAKRRRDQIYERLRELGYDDKDLKVPEKRWHKLTLEPRELTERTWKRIKPELVDIIESRKYLGSLDWYEESDLSTSEEDSDGNKDEESDDDEESDA